MEKYFEKFRNHIIGVDQEFETPNAWVKMIYADWIASGRLYRPIEEQIIDAIGPFVGNTHTETSVTGTLMTKAYHYAHARIKEHVNASEEDVIITAGFGMTAVINKLQRIMGMRICGEISHGDCLKKMEKPVVFVTHMEHHSNHTSWFETVAEVVVLDPGEDMLVDLNILEEKLIQYKDRKVKIGSFTACSNVTGIFTPYHKMAALMHKHGGLCFVDFAACAPYSHINMHPENPEEKLDAIFFSPHKFLGGPSSSGVLIFDKHIYKDHAPPDQPGGGTVDWTNRWGEYKYVDDIEAREDGGTPGFLQAMRTALAINLKEQMGVENIEKREKQLLKIVFEELPKIPGLHILADHIHERLGVVSFYMEGIHYNLIVKILNDRFGIQVRGGCACAGTYGHYLLDVSYEKSREITDLINKGDLSEKPGWVRLSLHPTMRTKELHFIIEAIGLIQKLHHRWEKEYQYNPHTNEFRHRNENLNDQAIIEKWFKL